MKILFVCSANICRSALAEVILRKKLKEKGLADIVVDSAGVHNYAGEPRDYMMCSYARKAGYEMGGESKYISQEQADSADLIVCMEHFHVVEMQKRLPYVRWGRIKLFNEICFDEQTNLIDPSGDTGYIYHYVFEKIQEGCGTLAWKLSKMLRQSEIFF
jgi:protein-tyrosine phosphatase